VGIEIQNNTGYHSDCGAVLANGATYCILQPGQSTYVFASMQNVDYHTFEYTIGYEFPSGGSVYDQAISLDDEYSTPQTVGSMQQLQQFGNAYSISPATLVGQSQSDADYGQEMASWMGLHGTGEIVVAQLIDWLVCLAGYNPDMGVTYTYYYSVTIGQSDYNIDNIAFVDWSSLDYRCDPPSVALIQGQQIFQYNLTNYFWIGSENFNNKATILASGYAASGDLYTGIGVTPLNGSAASLVYYDSSRGIPQKWPAVNFLNTNAIVQLSINPNASPLQYVAAFGDSAIEYYDGTNSHVFNSGTRGQSGILQMCVNWSNSGAPQVLVGCADGTAWYWHGLTDVIQLINSGQEAGSAVMQLSAYWDSNDNLQAVAGLGNGFVLYWNLTNGTGPTAYTVLNPGDILDSWDSPVMQLNATFSSNQPPTVLASTYDGNIYYYTSPASGWTNIFSSQSCFCNIIDVAPSSVAGQPPTFLAGFTDGSMQLYDGNAGWTCLYPATVYPATGDRVQFLSGKWIVNPSFDNLVYVLCINYQFTYGFGVGYQSYPATPNVSSTCGNVGGTGLNNLAGVAGSKNIGSTGLDDLISVVDSKWYVWFASSQYSTRGGPYDLGISGKPVTGDIDGDRFADLITVVGSQWYVLFSSSGYTQRLGPFDLGIHGKPLTGDIDGDGLDDLIMVMGSLWYYWPSSSGYTQRVGPGDLGIHGLPATGDIDGDGLADLISVAGSDWYVWFSSSQYSAHYIYNMGISGAPVTGDIDGDGLADLIAIVGSDWYVRLSSSGYTQLFGSYTKSVL